MAAADHAASAKHATRPRRTIASEIGVRNLLSRLTKKHGDVCAPERCALADLLRAFPQDTIRLGEPWIGRRAQHPLCGGVVRRERLLPVRAGWPFGAPEDLGSRNRKGIRVDQASSANPAAGADQDVTQESQSQDAVAKQLRHPQGASEVPVRERKVRGRETLARLEDRDLVALLGEAESSHRAAEPGSDHQHVVLVDDLHGWHAPPTARPCQSAVSPWPVVDFGLAMATSIRTKRYRASWNGAVIAESPSTVGVEGNQYFPVDDVRNEYLRPSDTHTTCHWKGVASYYDVVVGDAVNGDAAWYYPEPSEAAERVRNKTAFWRGVPADQVAD